MACRHLVVDERVSWNSHALWRSCVLCGATYCRGLFLERLREAIRERHRIYARRITRP